jgi:hypothetical protein
VGLPIALNCKFLNMPAKGNPMNMEEVRSELDGLFVMQAALTTLVCALIRSHPDEANFQLSAVETLEVLLSGPVGKTLSSKQKDQVRDAVETLRSLHPRKPSVPIESHRF